MKTMREHKSQAGRPPAWIRLVVVTTLLVSVSMPLAAAAVDVSGTSNTYLLSRKQADGTRLTPAYEYLDFNVQNLGDEAVSAHFGGWFRYDLSEQTSNSDVQYGYLSFRSKSDNSIVNLGRVMVFEGLAAERVDGLYARTDLAGNFGISAFGGSPVETQIDLPGNNLIYGARLTHQAPGVYRVGVSYLKEEKNRCRTVP